MDKIAGNWNVCFGERSAISCQLAANSGLLFNMIHHRGAATRREQLISISTLP